MTFEWVGDPILRLTFENGVMKRLDVSPLLRGWRCSPQETVDPLVRIVPWPSGADLAPEALYSFESADGIVRFP